MGADKALLEINGETLLNRTFGIVRSLFPKVYLCGTGAQNYKIDGAEVCEDIYKGGGPLSGIHAGLSRSDKEINFVLSCDLPLLTAEAVCAVAERYNSESILAVSSDERAHYLFGIYNRRILETIDELFAGYEPGEERNKNLSLYSLAGRCGARLINFDADELSRHKKALFNLNTAEDLKALISKPQ